MIIFGIIGFVLIFWFLLEGLVKFIPYLAMFTVLCMSIGFVMDHPWITLILVIASLGIYGIFLNYKDDTKEQKLSFGQWFKNQMK